MTSVLVTGGAGYIGSHMVRLLTRHGAKVTVFDDLTTGHRDSIRDCDFVQGDLRNPKDIEDCLRRAPVDVVMHFAASCYVGESMLDPEKYFRNNIAGTVNLLGAMRSAGVRRLVFSSTCSTYGEPVKVPIDESHPQKPVNPYGLSKLVAERMMREYARAYSFGVIALRYFNAAGCDRSGGLGERHDPETHLIPLVLTEARRVASGGSPEGTQLRVFGSDFDTPDGTCIRDYIHVEDLCRAHALAMDRLLASQGGGFDAFNLGTGHGFSVKEVIDACRHVTGIDIRYQVVSRRPGDPARLVAQSERARVELGWNPEISDLRDLIATAWRWFSR